jgi:hypothetical protein
MLVIKGKAQKSLVLNNRLNEWNKKDTLIVDTVGFNAWNEEVNVMPLEGSVEEVIKLLTENKNVIEKYKRIVFYINGSVQDEFKVWKFEQELMKRLGFRECVVTIQDRSLDELSIYEV